MTFITLLLTLFIDRVLWDVSPLRSHLWFERYLGKINAGQRFDSTYWGLGVILLPLLLLIGWLQGVFGGVGGLIEIVFGAGVLLWSIGPRDLGRDAERYLQARRNDQPAARLALAEHFDPLSAPHNPDEAVVRGILSGLCNRLIAPLFWFLLLGPVGAAGYRLAHLLHHQLQQRQPESALAQATVVLVSVLDWLPVRITLIGYAIAGNFDKVADAWQLCTRLEERACGDDQALLLEAGQAALEPDEISSAIRIEDALALAWRNLTLWVVLVGTVSLFAAL